MPELNIAPSPSPVVSNANNIDPTAAKAPAAEGAKIEGDGGQATTPFAAILKDQMKPAVDSKAAKAVAALLDAASQASGPAVAAIAADTAVVAQEDALAFLAPMLAGLAPTTAEAGKKDATVEEDAEDAAPVLIAAALPIAVVAQGTPATSAQATTASTPVAPVADTPERTPANLAAAAAVVAENTEASGNSRSTGQQSFDTLLNAAREASLTAANNSVATHTNTQATAIQPPTTTPVATPVGAQGWDNEVGQKIVWMANRQESRAEFVLNPPHLGRIEVSLSMNGDQANASFVSTNPAVREALENAVPRLREIMQDAGISLGQAQVGAESFQQSANNKENSDNRARGGGDTRDTGVAAPAGFVDGGTTSSRWLSYGNGLVDTFA